MFNPCFFVQNNYVERVTAPVALYARARGIDLVDRSSKVDFDPDSLDIDWSQWHPVLPVGSVQFLKALRQSPCITSYIHHDEHAFSSPKCLAELGDSMLNHGGIELVVQDIPDLLGKGRLHIRPSYVDKAFTAKIFDATSWAAVVTDRKLSDNLLCWVSPVRNISGEWRCWVVGGEVIDISRYRQDDHMAINRDVPEHVLLYAKEKAKGWLPASVVVMDISQSEDGLNIIEFNPLHSSGWYAADIPKVLDAWVSWSRQYYA